DSAGEVWKGVSSAGIVGEVSSAILENLPKVSRPDFEGLRESMSKFERYAGVFGGYGEDEYFDDIFALVDGMDDAKSSEASEESE
ncbi:hypothetical protein HKX48_000656, partial [Thoreauomyces humboldtii]